MTQEQLKIAKGEDRMKRKKGLSKEVKSQLGKDVLSDKEWQKLLDSRTVNVSVPVGFK